MTTGTRGTATRATTRQSTITIARITSVEDQHTSSGVVITTATSKEEDTGAVEEDTVDTRKEEVVVEEEEAIKRITIGPTTDTSPIRRSTDTEEWPPVARVGGDIKEAVVVAVTISVEETIKGVAVKDSVEAISTATTIEEAEEDHTITTNVRIKGRGDNSFRFSRVGGWRE